VPLLHVPGLQEEQWSRFSDGAVPFSHGLHFGAFTGAACPSAHGTHLAPSGDSVATGHTMHRVLFSSGS